MFKIYICGNMLKFFEYYILYNNSIKIFLLILFFIKSTLYIFKNGHTIMPKYHERFNHIKLYSQLISLLLLFQTIVKFKGPKNFFQPMVLFVFLKTFRINILQSILTFVEAFYNYNVQLFIFQFIFFP